MSGGPYGPRGVLSDLREEGGGGVPKVYLIGQTQKYLWMVDEDDKNVSGWLMMMKKCLWMINDDDKMSLDD